MPKNGLLTFKIKTKQEVSGRELTLFFQFRVVWICPKVLLRMSL